MSSSGGSGGSSSLQTNATNYGVVADGVTRSDGVITGNQLSCAGYQFVNAAAPGGDVGKLCAVVAAGTPVSATLSGALTSGTPVYSIPVTATAAVMPPGAYTVSDGATHSQTFYCCGAPAGATSLPVMVPALGVLNQALSTGGPITSLPVFKLTQPPYIAANATVTVIDPTFQNIQQFTCTLGGSQGQTTIAVSSETPTYAFPIGSIVCFQPSTQAQSYTPNFSYQAGATVTSMIPALLTTIQSVSGGVATLAAAAGTNIASGAEVFFAHDDTTSAQNAINATPAGGTCAFPNGQVGLSATLSTTSPLRIVGQGVSELGGSLSEGAIKALNQPTVPPYLDGTSFVMCAANTDILQLNGNAVVQDLENVGLRFAGRFQNTGHGLNTIPPLTPSGGGLYDVGIQYGTLRNVAVFGQDGNHYAFHIMDCETSTHYNLRGYGGGGYRFYQLNSASSFGNLSVFHIYTCTLVSGLAHCFTLEALGGSTIDYSQFVNIQPYLNVAEFANTIQPNGQCQYQIWGAGPIAHVGFVGPDLESNGPARTLWMPGPIDSDANPQGNYVIGWNQADSPISTTGFATGGGPTSGSDNQNIGWSAQLCAYSVTLAPAATAPNSTTVSSTTTYNSITLPVTSATGFAAGQAIQVDTGTATEFAIIQSVSGNTLTLNNPTANTHNSGVTVSNGAAAYIVSLSNLSLAGNINLGVPVMVAAGAGDQTRTQLLTFVVPAGWHYRADEANVKNTRIVYTSIAA